MRATPDEKRGLCRKSADVWSVTTYTQFATWAAVTIRCHWLPYGCLKWVRHLFDALAAGIEKDAAAYGTGPPGARGQTSSTGGV